jgi:hypothetical protein
LAVVLPWNSACVLEEANGSRFLRQIYFNRTVNVGQQATGSLIFTTVSCFTSDNIILCPAETTKREMTTGASAPVPKRASTSILVFLRAEHLSLLLLLLLQFQP